MFNTVVLERVMYNKFKKSAASVYKLSLMSSNPDTTVAFERDIKSQLKIPSFQNKIFVSEKQISIKR